MDINRQNPFLQTIFHLRKDEDIILYSKLITIHNEELLLVNDLLEDEYRNEKTGYPYTPPEYDSEAALWAAKTLYTIAQLILYREHKETDIASLLPAYSEPITAGAILSADLCLRFLPQIKREARNIDPEDVLLPEINRILETWHYSGIGTDFDLEKVDYTTVLAEPCLTQLYADRIMLKKDRNLAQLPQWSGHIKASMGIHSRHFWKELEL
jgi:hypothetical protein